MAQGQPKQVRVKALKMFKAPNESGLPIMVHPGDVVEVDRFLGGLLMSSGKAEETTDKLAINREYKEPARVTAPDAFSAILSAVQNLNATLSAQKGR